jgi:excisionase family DNA binding protein
MQTISFQADIPDEFIDRIAERVIAKFGPLLATDKVPDDLLTIEEATAFLSTSKGQVYQWVDKSRHGLGDFPFMKMKRLLRFSKKEIIQWMKSNSRRLETR